MKGRSELEYLLHILILVEIYIFLSVSLNLISGFTGILSIGHAAFFGVGAYTAALMSLNMQTPFFINLIIACLLSMALSVFVAIPTLRIRDDYFVIATLAFQTIVYNVLNNWISLTGGPMGVPAIPNPRIFGITISTHLEFFLVFFILGIVVLFSLTHLTKSSFGRVLKSIREDDFLSQSFGKNVLKYKVLVFALGAAISAVAGVMYAHYITFIDPSTFTVMESVFILTIVIVGGAGNLWGSVLGTIILVVLPEILRFIGLPSSVAANVRQIIYGGLLVAFMMWRPQGLLGKYAFRSGETGE